MAKCGECLYHDVEIVELNENGVCPRCGADYGRSIGNETIPAINPDDDDDDDDYGDNHDQ